MQSWETRGNPAISAENLLTNAIGRRENVQSQGSKIVVVGAGFAGLAATKLLSQNSQNEIILIDKFNHHLFKPLLYQVATAGLSPADIAVPVRAIFKNQKNVTVFQDEITHVNFEGKSVSGKKQSFPFDYLILACGTRYTYFKHQDWQENAPNLGTIRSALNIRERLLDLFELAELKARGGENGQAILNVIIIGAGPTGVEMAGAISELCRFGLKNNFRYIDPALTNIYLIEGGPEVLPPFPQKLRDKTREALENMGVHVLTGKKVEEINSEGVRVQKNWIYSQVIIWAAGVQGQDLAEHLPIDLVSQSKVPVTPTLQLKGFPSVFSIGDMNHSEDKTGEAYPDLAPVAIQQGKYVAKSIGLLQIGKEIDAYHYFDKGQLATIGRSKAVGVFRGLKFWGFPAWFIWSAVHIFYLVGHRNKVSVLLNWSWSYFNYGRGMRLFTHEDHLIGDNLHSDSPSKSSSPLGPEESETPSYPVPPS